MSVIHRREGHLRADGRRFAVVGSRFNERWVEPLVNGACDCLLRHGARSEDLEVVRVPGAFEIPLALEELATAGGYDGLVAVGVILRGETAHFEHIAGECSRGAASVALRYRLPVGFGVLICDLPEQVEARAGGKLGNKGWEAAAAALEMADLLSRLRQPVRP